MTRLRQLAILVCLFVLSGAQAADSFPATIDRLIEQRQIGPVAGVASDSTFVRRIYLDLIGRIPSIGEAKKFLAEKAPNRRAALVDELMKRPAFNRNLARQFDLMLMERRKDNYVKSDPWREYLVGAMEENRPYHKLVHDLLAADGAGKGNHAAAKFYLEREAEPSALTRDIGRIFFGMDIQCAQCHDHPNVDDYLQRDYYGIQAFVNRLSVFRPDKKKPAVLAEKAEGNTEFKSVFTSIEGSTTPKLPGGQAISEPTVAKGKEWKVAPDKKDKKKRAIPAYSRREQLPKQLADGKNEAFRRNIVNRLWAQMMGRGLVEPVDFHHSSNPPSHPELLDHLATEFAEMKFDIRGFLRALAKTRTYQRSFAMPEELVSSAGALSEQIDRGESESKKLQTASQAAWEATEKLRGDLEQIYAAIAPLNKSLTAAKSGVPKLEKIHKATQPGLDRALANLKKRKKQFEPHFKKARDAKAKDPKKDDPKRKPTSDERRALSYEKQLRSYQGTHDKALKKERDAFAKLAEARGKVADIEKQIAVAKKRVPEIEEQLVEADGLRRSRTLKSKLATRELRQLQALGEFHELKTQLGEADLKAGEKTGIAARLESASRELTGIWSDNCAVAGLVPLSPEQLAFSLMEATGEREKQRAAGGRDFDKKAKDKNKKKWPVPSDRDQYVEMYASNKLRSKVATFVNLFDAGGAQNAFFASADQALYFENGGDLRSWLSPSSNNLVDRLRKTTEPARFAAELYLSTLTRRPTKRESTAVAEFLKGREKDLSNAAQEMAWALLTSNEFRFKH
jgi:hypothetical protein